MFVKYRTISRNASWGIPSVHACDPGSAPSTGAMAWDSPWSFHDITWMICGDRLGGRSMSCENRVGRSRSSERSGVSAPSANRGRLANPVLVECPVAGGSVMRGEEGRDGCHVDFVLRFRRSGTEVDKALTLLRNGSSSRRSVVRLSSGLSVRRTARHCAPHHSPRVVPRKAPIDVWQIDERFWRHEERRNEHDLPSAPARLNSQSDRPSRPTPTGAYARTRPIPSPQTSCRAR